MNSVRPGALYDFFLGGRKRRRIDKPHRADNAYAVSTAPLQRKGAHDDGDLSLLFYSYSIILIS